MKKIIAVTALAVGISVGISTATVTVYHHLWLAPALAARPTLATLNIDALTREMVVLLARSNEPEDALRRRLEEFRGRIEEAVDVVEARDQVLLINSAALMGEGLRDYTDVVREALALPAPAEPPAPTAGP